MRQLSPSEGHADTTRFSFSTPLPRYMQVLMQTLDDPEYDLDDTRLNYTVFVANNDAFSSLPWDTVSTLMVSTNWTTEVRLYKDTILSFSLQSVKDDVKSRM